MLAKITDKEKYTIDLAMVKGSSNLLNGLPLKCYNFVLTKSKNKNGIALREGWQQKKCQGYGHAVEKSKIALSLHCPKEATTSLSTIKTLDTRVFAMVERRTQAIITRLNGILNPGNRL